MYIQPMSFGNQKNLEPIFYFISLAHLFINERYAGFQIRHYRNFQ